MSYSFRQGDLPRLDLQVDRGSDFKAWKSQWDAYISLSGLDKEPPAKQVQALTLCFARETVTIVDNLGLTAEQKLSVSEIVSAVQRYVEGQVNESVERRNFRRRVQQPGETFDDFLVSLRELSKTCKFCSDECNQKNIRNQIIEGISDGDTVEDLLQERNLSLDMAIAKCRAQEAAKKHRGELTSHADISTQVQVVRQHSGLTSRPPQKMCMGCGSAPHPGGRQNCPAFNRVCHNCRITGHLAHVCKKKGRALVPGPHSQSQHSAPGTLSLQADYLLEEHGTPQINSSKVSHTFEPAPTIRVHVASLNGNTTIPVLPDSGADISVAGPSMLEKLNEHPDNLLPSNVRPRAGNTMTPIGKLPVTISLGQVTYSDEVHIYPQVRNTLLSWKTAKGLRILSPSYPHPMPSSLPQIAAIGRDPLPSSSSIMAEFPRVFDGQVKVMEGEVFHIGLVDNAQPFCVHTPRAIPFAYREKLKTELDLLQSQGIIAPVTTPTEWCAPIVVTPKKNTDRIRLCVDLSKLNRYVKRERYQSNTPAQAVADIAAENARIFTKLDALKGYHQCPLDSGSQLLTTFITPFGRFKFLRAPYGISSISEHYNRRMDEAFAGLQGYRRIVDDVVIFDKDEAQHASHVREFLQRCLEKKITINTEKWVYVRTKVSFAGFLISHNGYSIENSITSAISNFPTPTNRTDLRSFFGLVNQLSSSTPTVMSLLSPLRSLLSTKNEFLWSATHTEAFHLAKQALSSAPTLSFFDSTKPTRLCTDASRRGLGFILQQKIDDQWYLVQAGSRFLSDSESRYAIIELEMLALAWAIAKSRLFLAGLPHFLVVTDHHPLVPILNNHCLDEIENPRLQRLKTRIMG